MQTFEYKELEEKYKNLQEKYKEMESRYLLVEKENREFSRRLAINDNHEQLEDIFSKLSSLILASKSDENMDLSYKEQSLIKDLFGSKKLT